MTSSRRLYILKRLFLKLFVVLLVKILPEVFAESLPEAFYDGKIHFSELLATATRTSACINRPPRILGSDTYERMDGWYVVLACLGIVFLCPQGMFVCSVVTGRRPERSLRALLLPWEMIPSDWKSVGLTFLYRISLAPQRVFIFLLFCSPWLNLVNQGS